MHMKPITFVLLVGLIIAQLSDCFPRSRPFFASLDKEWNQKLNRQGLVPRQLIDREDALREPCTWDYKFLDLLAAWFIRHDTCPNVNISSVLLFFCGLCISYVIQYIRYYSSQARNIIRMWKDDGAKRKDVLFLSALVKEGHLQSAAKFLQDRINTTETDLPTGYYCRDETVALGVRKHQLGLILLADKRSSLSTIQSAFCLLSEALQVYRVHGEDQLVDRIRSDMDNYVDTGCGSHVLSVSESEWQVVVPASLILLCREHRRLFPTDSCGSGKQSDINFSCPLTQERLEAYKSALLRGRSNYMGNSPRSSAPVPSGKEETCKPERAGDDVYGEVMAFLNDIGDARTPISEVQISEIWTPVGTPKRKSFLLPHHKHSDEAQESPTGLIISPERPQYSSDSHTLFECSLGGSTPFPSVGVL